MSSKRCQYPTEPNMPRAVYKEPSRPVNGRRLTVSRCAEYGAGDDRRDDCPGRSRCHLSLGVYGHPGIAPPGTRQNLISPISNAHSLMCCTPICLVVGWHPGVPILRAICGMPCTPVGSESSRSKSRCVRADSSDASARLSQTSGVRTASAGQCAHAASPPGDCASTDLVDAVYRSEVTYLTLCS